MTQDNGAQSGLAGASLAAGTDEAPTLRQDLSEIEAALERSRRHEQPPAPVPGYAISRRLGEGAFGSVWLALDQNTGKQVAIKYYTHRRGLDWSLLNREVEKLAVLYTSRNIVRLLDVGWDADPPHYVMEYLENGSLAAFLAEGPLPVHEAVRIAKIVLQALVHAHGAGILHCDLKPANVLLDADFDPRLCDFGQSRLSDEQSPALGTLFYMAPEQADLRAVPDARWDVYALGSLLYHMLCGEPPCRTPENERRIAQVPGLEERLEAYRRVLAHSPRPTAHRKVPGVDRRLAEIVDRCLEVDPQNRFPNAQAVLDALEQRERQRARRPLVALGIVGPALLLAAMTPIVGRAMQSAVESARQNLTERALESDVLSARILARGLERELDDRQARLVEVSEDPALVEAILAAEASGWSESAAVAQVLDEKKRVVGTGDSRDLDTSWFLTDARGIQRWRGPDPPPGQNTIGKSYAWRNYFHGRDLGGAEYDPEHVPDDVEPIRAPHVSLAFQSEATGRYMVAISVPIWNPERTRVVGVLARTTHLGELLDVYEQRIGSPAAAPNEVNRIIALVDRRDWELLHHHWMRKDTQWDIPFDKLTVDERIREKLTRLQQRGDAEAGTSTGDGAPRRAANGDDRDDRYLDPVGRFEPETYGGEWLAAFAPIGQTGWTAIVQERRDAALGPVEEMRAGLIRYSLWALGVSCALVGLLWYFVSRALNDRGGRNWPADATLNPPRARNAPGKRPPQA